jgi:WD40 repeat protein
VRRNIPTLSCIESHPQLNYYLAGLDEEKSHEGIVNLYQFDQTRELVTYSTGSSGKITKCRYDPYGSNFGAVDMKGNMYLWKFDSSSIGIKPWSVYNCHSSLAHDMVFLSSSSFVASAGLAINFKYFCFF